MDEGLPPLTLGAPRGRGGGATAGGAATSGARTIVSRLARSLEALQTAVAAATSCAEDIVDGDDAEMSAARNTGGSGVAEARQAHTEAVEAACAFVRAGGAVGPRLLDAAARAVAASTTLSPADVRSSASSVEPAAAAVAVAAAAPLKLTEAERADESARTTALLELVYEIVTSPAAAPTQAAKQAASAASAASSASAGGVMMASGGDDLFVASPLFGFCAGGALLSVVCAVRAGGGSLTPVAAAVSAAAAAGGDAGADGEQKQQKAAAAAAAAANSVTPLTSRQRVRAAMILHRVYAAYPKCRKALRLELSTRVRETRRRAGLRGAAGGGGSSGPRLPPIGGAGATGGGGLPPRGPGAGGMMGPPPPGAGASAALGTYGSTPPPWQQPSAADAARSRGVNALQAAGAAAAAAAAKTQAAALARQQQGGGAAAPRVPGAGNMAGSSIYVPPATVAAMEPLQVLLPLLSSMVAGTASPADVSRPHGKVWSAALDRVLRLVEVDEMADEFTALQATYLSELSDCLVAFVSADGTGDFARRFLSTACEAVDLLAESLGKSKVAIVVLRYMGAALAAARRRDIPVDARSLNVVIQIMCSRCFESPNFTVMQRGLIMTDDDDFLDFLLRGSGGSTDPAGEADEAAAGRAQRMASSLQRGFVATFSRTTKLMIHRALNRLAERVPELKEWSGKLAIDQQCDSWAKEEASLAAVKRERMRTPRSDLTFDRVAWDKPLGTGAFGTVRSAVVIEFGSPQSTWPRFAVKTVHKDPRDDGSPHWKKPAVEEAVEESRVEAAGGGGDEQMADAATSDGGEAAAAAEAPAPPKQPAAAAGAYAAAMAANPADGAVDPITGKVVDAVALLKAEIELLRSSAECDAIVRFIGEFEDERRHFLVMELAEKGDVFDLVRGQGSVSATWARYAVARAATALHFLHGQGYVHADVKPENLLIMHDGIVKLADLGSAMHIASAHKQERILLTGTAEYTAYELADDAIRHARGGSAAAAAAAGGAAAAAAAAAAAGGDMMLHSARAELVGPATDWWGLGCVLFQLLEGRAPFMTPSTSAAGSASPSSSSSSQDDNSTQDSAHRQTLAHVARMASTTGPLFRDATDPRPDGETARAAVRALLRCDPTARYAPGGTTKGEAEIDAFFEVPAEAPPPPVGAGAVRAADLDVKVKMRTFSMMYVQAANATIDDSSSLKLEAIPECDE